MTFLVVPPACATGHDTITFQALKAMMPNSVYAGMSAEAVSRIASANIGVDSRETGTPYLTITPSAGCPSPADNLIFPVNVGAYIAAHHFDRAGPNDPATNKSAFRQGLKYLIQQREGAVNRLLSAKGCADVASALDTLGTALHALQDVFSHSNYVDLGKEDRLTIDLALALTDAGSADTFNTPPSFKLTAYNPAFPEAEVAGGDTYSHKCFRKDYANKNYESQRPSSDGGTKFQAAEALAERGTLVFMQSVANEVGLDNWLGLTEFFGKGQQYCGLCVNCTQPVRKVVESVTSNDPNDKVGSQGIGSSHFLTGSEPLRYSIYFENTPTASASAQDVIVTDPLDKTRVDLNTLMLGPISFTDKLITPSFTPLTLGTFSQDLDLRPAQNLIARVSASLNASSGVLTWHFQSIDPATGKPTTDPVAGFLPIGGEGSVTFTVQSLANLPTNTSVPNKATVVFDGKPLDTPVWLNTLDNTAPTSKVSSLTNTQTSPNFTVQWSGTDVGSGVQDYTINASDNGGPFAAWQTNTAATAATFTGQVGHTYGFYSIARDLTGNVEGAKTSAEATTTISQGIPGDVNGDGKVDCADIAIVKASFGKKTGQLGFDARADVNLDGVVDIRDLAYVSQKLPAGTKCP